MTENKKAKEVFFVEWEDVDSPHYVKCRCLYCGKTEYIDCGKSPAYKSAILYNINYQGWRFYDEHPDSLDGSAGLVCPDCVGDITGTRSGDCVKLYKHFQEGDLEQWLNKKNLKTLKRYGIK